MKMFLLLLCIVCTSAGNAAKPADAPVPDLYATDFWEVAGEAGKTTWVEIHNSKEVAQSGVAHVAVLARKKGAPVWEIEWVCPHLAITTEALKKSVLHPLKTKGAYPERYFEAYRKWQEDEKKGAAVVCGTSVAEGMKAGR